MCSKKPLGTSEYDRPIYEEFHESESDYSYYGQFGSMLPEDPENIRILVGAGHGFFESVIKSGSPTRPPRVE